jgi:DNA-binding transcriptional regulator/RsmH inhibitor MraZ
LSRANAATVWSSPTTPSNPVPSTLPAGGLGARARPGQRAAARQEGQPLLQLKLVGAAEFVELDGNGRISIPASHRAAVAIEKKAVLLGMGEKFELWSEQAHHAQIRQTVTDDDLSDELLELQL